MSETLNATAMVVGYVVMGLGAVCSVSLVVGLACTYAWRKLLRDAPSWYYVQNAVAHYRTVYPPSRWVREQLGPVKRADPDYVADERWEP